MQESTKGALVSETTFMLDDCCEKSREMIAATRKIIPDIMIICHGGSVADPVDAEYVIKNVPEIDGFFGAPSIERLASERGMTAQAAAFKAITKYNLLHEKIFPPSTQRRIFVCLNLAKIVDAS